MRLLQQPLRSDIKLNKKVFVFLICLLISFFIWLQINLSKQQSENLPVNLIFTNLPKTRFGSAKLSDKIFLEVEARGYDLLNYKMKDILIDFRKLKKARNPELYLFIPNAYIKNIGKQLGTNFKVIKALTDTIQLNPPLQ